MNDVDSAAVTALVISAHTIINSSASTFDTMILTAITNSHILVNPPQLDLTVIGWLVCVLFCDVKRTRLPHCCHCSVSDPSG